MALELGLEEVFFVDLAHGSLLKVTYWQVLTLSQDLLMEGVSDHQSLLRLDGELCLQDVDHCVGAIVGGGEADEDDFV
jgi:hypothetical protein